jgi:hypothetical protein
VGLAIVAHGLKSRILALMKPQAITFHVPNCSALPLNLIPTKLVALKEAASEKLVRVGK